MGQLPDVGADRWTASVTDDDTLSLESMEHDENNSRYVHVGSHTPLPYQRECAGRVVNSPASEQTAGLRV